MKNKTFEMYVIFQGKFIKVEDYGGMNKNLIIFNPETADGFPDYKIQLSEKVYLKDIITDELINIEDMSDNFLIINTKGDIITNSEDLKPELVELILEKIETELTSDNLPESLN